MLSIHAPAYGSIDSWWNHDTRVESSLTSCRIRQRQEGGKERIRLKSSRLGDTRDRSESAEERRMRRDQKPEILQLALSSFFFLTAKVFLGI